MGVFTINSNDNQAPSPLISWNDTSTTENRSGSASTIIIKIDSITDPEGQSITSIWQINTGSGFVDNVAVTSNPMNFGPNNGVNQYRIKSTDAYGVVGYSNILQYTYSAPQYDNYFVESPRTDCNTGSSTNFISFNSSGGYRTGVNYSGATPVTLRLLSFSDTMVELVGTSEVALSFTPSVLRDSSNTPLTYPYNVSLPSSSVSDVGINQSPASPEIVCPSNPGNQVRRRRIITYQVIDTNGTVGPIRTSELDLLYTPQTLPTQLYCLEAHWDCEDSVHNCPGVCGSVTYIDEFGNQQTESGYCINDGIIQIVASSIVSHIGMNIVTCSGTRRDLLQGNMTCGAGQVHFTGTSIILYSQSSGSNIIDGDRLFTDSGMTTPYTPTTNKFIKDTNNNYIYSVDGNGYITYEGYQGGPC